MGVEMLRLLVGETEQFSHIFIYNRTCKVCEDFVASLSNEQQQRMTICESPEQALSAQKQTSHRLLASIVSNDAALDSICERLLPELGEGDVHLCLSTVSGEIVTRQAEAASIKAGYFVSCPVFGRPNVVAAKKAISVPSGHSEAVEKIRPILQSFSQKIVYGGNTPSNSSVLKLCGNFCVLSIIQMSAEYMALAESYGIDRDVAYELLSSPQGVFSLLPIFSTYGKIIKDRAYSPPGFTAENGLKDATLINAAAKEGGVQGALLMPLLQQQLELTCSADPSGGKDIDWSSFAELVKPGGGRK
jgi:3-hydroxyisobutyrate dehydrogenase-like beta-hydroxyacid dehydrogenase